MIILCILSFALESVVADTDFDERSILKYKIENGAITITDCDSNVTEVEIPSEINGYPVKYIGDSAFVFCDNLTTIVIPDSVKSIGRQSFAFCRGLANVTIGNGITSIGRGAFEGCSSLLNINIPDSVESIDEYAFHDCQNLEKINVSKNNRYFSNDERGALFDKEKTKLIQYPTGNTTSYYKIPDSVKTICHDAFLKSIYLTGVDISANTTDIGLQAFYGCYNITSIVVPDSVTNIDDMVFAYCDSLESVVIGNNVENIGAHAFLECYSLININIPDRVKIMGTQMFYGCSNLESVTIGSGVEQLSDSTFEDCSSLATILVEESNASYFSDENGILFNKDKTRLIRYPAQNKAANYSIPDSVAEIGDVAFAYCKYLTTIFIPHGVKNVSDETFRNCTSLISITVDENNIYYSSDEKGVLFNKDKTTLIVYPAGKKESSYVIPDGVTNICKSAFRYCYNLAAIVISDSVTDIADYTFYQLNMLKNVVIGKGVKNIGRYAFGCCYNLESVVIGDSVTNIDGCAFYECKSLVNIVIPDNVKNINKYAFYDCNNLTGITIGNGVASIGNKAFYGCYNLSTIYYRGTEDEWEKISIDLSNTYLLDADIKFLAFTKTSISADGKSFIITPINIENGKTVILAVYNGDVFVEMQSAVYTGEAIPFKTNMAYAKAKVMVWDNLTNLKPVCDVEVVK